MDIDQLLQAIPCPHWLSLITEQLNQPRLKQLFQQRINPDNRNAPTFPPKEQIFNAFIQTPFHQVKVVILGQDPYHKEGQAHGLAFSVPHAITPPPSLRNIFKAMQHDLETPMPTHGNLSSWAQQGVLLLNTTLTVEAGKPLSHEQAGWEPFTDAVIQSLNQHKDSLIFLLWGTKAQKKRSLIDLKKHTVLAAPHPSPLSAYRGFIECRHFSQTNQLLLKNKKKPIAWDI